MTPLPLLLPSLYLSLSIDSKFGINARKNEIYDAEGKMGYVKELGGGLGENWGRRRSCGEEEEEVRLEL